MPIPSRVALLSIHSSPFAPVGTEHSGGMNIYVRRLADELTRQGVEVDLFTRRTSPSAPEIIQLPAGPRLIHLRAGPARPLPKNVLPLHIPRVVAAFREHTEKHDLHYDVLHSHYWLSGFVAARCRPDASVPIVQMFHTLSLVKELYHGGPDPHDSALRPDGERCVIGSADAVVGATAQEEDYISELYRRSPRRFEVIPPGVDLDLFRPLDQKECRKELGIGPGHVVLFVGRADKIKGLNLLLSILSERRIREREPVRLVIVGAGVNRAERHALEAAVSRLGLREMVEIRGTMPHEDLPRYYSAADVLAVPSAYESFGMAAVEAMACGTPVVAFRIGGLAETVTHGVSGLLAPPGDRDAFASLLETALAHPKGGKLGRQARLAAYQFSWRNVAARTVSLYDDLLYRHRFACSRVAGQG
jgi:D-inositol-3-phosphate glycosyltransferase